MQTISPITLREAAFSKYGKILSTENSDSILINNGFANKHYNLCNIDCNNNNGVATVHLYEAKKREFPLKINMMEKHPHFSQTFIPRSKTPFLIVVALGVDEPELSTLCVFKTNGNQGVHYNKNVWHFPLISLEDNEQFIVIDRSDLGKIQNKVIDCIELTLNKQIEILKD